MKYMLLMSSTRQEFEAYASWSKEDLRASVFFMRDFAGELEKQGVLVSTVGLSFPDRARMVRAGRNGEPVTDGVFPESEEFLAGYWIVDVDSEEEAYRIAARAAQGPAPKGSSGFKGIEVRPVMESAPAEWL